MLHHEKHPEKPQYNMTTRPFLDQAPPPPISISFDKLEPPPPPLWRGGRVCVGGWVELFVFFNKLYSRLSEK